MESLQLPDLIGSYPDITNPDQVAYPQRYIYGKYEFASIPGKSTERVAMRGSFFNVQLFIQRFVRAFSSVFMFWRAGTGKTLRDNCSCRILQAEQEPVSAYIYYNQGSRLG